MEPSVSSRTSPEWNEPEVHKACQALMTGNLGAALMELNDRINRGELKTEAVHFWLRGIIHEAMGNFQEALQDMLRGAALSGATKHHMQQDICRLVNKVAESGKSAPWVAMVKAQCEAATGDYKAALETLGTTMSPMADYLRSLCYALLNDEENAVRHANAFMSGTRISDIGAKYKAVGTVERMFREAHNKKRGRDKHGEKKDSAE